MSAHPMTARDVIADAQDAIDSLLSTLGDWAKAYPLTVFSEPTQEERDWLHATKPGLMDRIGASMGRHMAGCIEADLAQLRAALSTLAQPSGEAVAHEIDEAALEAAVDAGRAALAPTRGPAPGFAQMRAGILAYMAAYTTPPAPLGGLTEGEREALQRLESRLTNGDFYSDYDNDWALVGKLREVIRRLTAPRAEGVDVPIGVVVSDGGVTWWDEVPKPGTSVFARPVAALTAAAPKVAAPQAEAGEPGPVATLHADGYWTWKGSEPHAAQYAGWTLDVFAAPLAQPAAQGGDGVGAEESFRVPTAKLLRVTEGLAEHPDDWDLPCWCATCRSYASDDTGAALAPQRKEGE